MSNHSSAVLNHEGLQENEGTRKASLEKPLKKLWNLPQRYFFCYPFWNKLLLVHCRF